MPSEMMDRQGFSSSSHISEEVHFPTERQIGFWKPETTIDHYAGGRSVASSPLDKLPPVEFQSMNCIKHPETYLIRDLKASTNLGRQAVGAERAASRSSTLLTYVDQDPRARSNVNAQSPSYFSEGAKINTMGSQYENGLFSSSLSELFGRKLRLSSNSIPYGHSVDTVSPHYEEEEPFESLEEIEAQTIGNLLPDDDDLLSGVTDGLHYIVQPSSGDDLEDFDLFSSVGGMELGDDGSSAGQQNTDLSEGIPNWQPGGSSGSNAGEHPYGEHPSRTLFVRNINSNVEDTELRALFEHYGDIRTLYTACKHRGFVMISYYDLRAARNAMRALQNKPLRRRKLDIHFSIPKDNPTDKDINQGTLVVFNLDSSVSNDEVRHIFGVYGEIKEIRETPHRSHHKFIEFYDVRAAEAALRALNRIDIAGKRIKLEPSRPGGAKQCITQHLLPELEHDELLLPSSPPNNSTTRLSGSIPRGANTSGIMEDRTNPGISSAIGAPIRSFLESPFHHGISSSVPNSLPSLVRVESVGNQSGLAESGHSHSQGQLQFDYQGMPALHPHSLPDYHDSFHCNSPGTMAASISPRSSGRIENGLLCGVNSNGHSLDLNENVFGSSGNGSCPLPVHHFMWANSHHPRPPGMMWPNSPSLINGLCTAHPPSRLHGLPRAPSHISSVIPINNHHVGSAPALNPPLWDRRHAFVGESPEASGFHPGSLGSVRMSNNSMHPLEFVPHNVFPHVGGNCVDLSIAPKNVGLHSPHQRCLMFPGRGQMLPMMSSFDNPNERSRSRRSENMPNQADNKKQYELDVERIMRGEDNRTTLMIKNIPNKYTSKMLLTAIDERHRGTYDFIYLPIDFKNKCNVGYAFINMTDPSVIGPFFEAFNGKKWEKFNSEKVASLAYARIQGKAALVAHFQNSSLMNEDKRCRPILFHTEGPNAGDQVPFPMGVNIRPRPGKTRTSTNEENHQGSPPNLANGEGSSCGDSSSGSARDSD